MGDMTKAGSERGPWIREKVSSFSHNNTTRNHPMKSLSSRFRAAKGDGSFTQLVELSVSGYGDGH